MTTILPPSREPMWREGLPVLAGAAATTAIVALLDGDVANASLAAATSFLMASPLLAPFALAYGLIWFMALRMLRRHFPLPQAIGLCTAASFVILGLLFLGYVQAHPGFSARGALKLDLSIHLLLPFVLFLLHRAFPAPTRKSP